MILTKGATFSVDWWSLGILIYELIFGFPPFYDENHNLMYNNILNNPVYFPENYSISKECKDLIT